MVVNRSSLARAAAVVALTICVGVLIPLTSIGISLLVSPAENVDTAGQSLALSAGPSASTSGPGTLELFGQSIPTTQEFSGPIRPRLLWAEVTHYNELLLALRQPEHLGQDLRDGWSIVAIQQLKGAAGQVAQHLLSTTKRVYTYISKRAEKGATSADARSHHLTAPRRFPICTSSPT